MTAAPLKERLHVADDALDTREVIRRSLEGQRKLAEMEIGYMQEVLASAGGNKSRTAEILDIDRRTLRKRWQTAAEFPHQSAAPDNFISE